VTSAIPPFKILRILSAYTSPNGVDVLEAILRRVYTKDPSATSLISVGIDQKRTPYESLNKLLQLKGAFPTLNVYIVHDDRLNFSFHPKLYNFESDSQAILFIGSSNLTRNGLSSNYEITTVFKIDLQSPANKPYCDFKQSIEPYFTPRPKSWVQALTYDLLNELEKGKLLGKQESEKKSGKSTFRVFGKGSMQATKTIVKFVRPVFKRKSKVPKIALQLTHWDTDPRHMETQIPRDVLNNGFFPSDNLILLFPSGKEKRAKLSHYQYHSRIYNKQILDLLNPREGDVLTIARISPTKFQVDLIRRNKITARLLRRLNKKSGKGKKWGWL
jgi:hypothetical protein